MVAKRITEYLKNTDRMSRTIVFCVDTEHALRMRNALAKENSDMMAENPDYVVRITGDDKIGKLKLDDFIDKNLWDLRRAECWSWYILHTPQIQGQGY